MKVWVIRHGHTKLNAGKNTSIDKERGWTDVPLSPEGKQEAQDTAKELKGKGIEHIVHSDLKRADQTAEVRQDVWRFFEKGMQN